MANALEDLFAGQPMIETEGAMFRPPPSTWADPKRAGGFGWGQLVHALGLLFRVADLDPEEVFAVTGKSPAGVDYYDAAVVRFGNGATGSLSGAATCRRAARCQIDLRIFGTEGMLLLDIERERLELRRRDGKDEVWRCRQARAAMPARSRSTFSSSFAVGGKRRKRRAGDRRHSGPIEVLDAMYRSRRERADGDAS